MSEIKAIETVYNGYYFRSRLEARWAVFFDAMNIRYIYEPEGYKVELSPNEIYRYLPDFFLPEYELFAEVKGADHRGQIPKEDAEKMSWMIDYGGPCRNGIILLGNIPDPDGAASIWWAIWRWMGKGLEYGYVLGDEPAGHSWDLDSVETLMSAPYYFNDDYQLTHAMYISDERGKAIHGSRIEQALTMARRARFEHGETPQV